MAENTDTSIETESDKPKKRCLNNGIWQNTLATRRAPFSTFEENTLCVSPSGKAEYTPENQVFVDVTEATANLNYITSVVQRKWGEEYSLVTCDGLKVDDSSGTQGTVVPCTLSSFDIMTQ